MKKSNCKGCKHFYRNQSRFGCKVDKHSFPVLRGNALERVFEQCPLPKVKPDSIDASTERVPSGDMKDKP